MPPAQLARCVPLRLSLPRSLAIPGNLRLTTVARCTELARGAKSLVRMEGNNTYLDPPEVRPARDGCSDVTRASVLIKLSVVMMYRLRM